MYSIKLANGNTLSNLELNGNNFISETILEDSIFEDGLSVVEISDGTKTETHTDMKLIANRVDGGKSWFILVDKTEREKATERLYEKLELEDISIADIKTALVELSSLI